jgi:hypothetical protein
MATLPFPIPYGQRASIEVYGDPTEVKEAKSHIMRQLEILRKHIKAEGKEVSLFISNIQKILRVLFFINF